MRNLITLLVFMTFCTMLQAKNDPIIKTNWDPYMDTDLNGNVCINLPHDFHILLYFQLQPGFNIPPDVYMEILLNKCYEYIPLRAFTHIGNNEYQLSYIPGSCIGGFETPLINYSFTIIDEENEYADIFLPYNLEYTDNPPLFSESGSKPLCQSSNFVGQTSTVLDAEKEESFIEKDILLMTEPIVFPNPFIDEFQLNYYLSDSAPMSVSLIDISGKTVYQWSENNVTEGNFNMKVDTSNLSPGMYAFVIQSNKKVQVIKLFKGKEY